MTSKTIQLPIELTDLVISFLPICDRWWYTFKYQYKHIK